MLLSIITINYKTGKKTAGLIESLYKHLGSNVGKSVELIVVDNASGDGDVSSLQKLRDEKGFKFVISQENIGFGAGINFGAQMAEGEILLLLNSDTHVKDNSIIQMADFLKERKDIAVLGGKLINEKGDVEKSCGKFYSVFQLLLMLLGGERLGLDRSSPEKITKVDWVSGGFMMVKRDAFEKLKGFDEDYFMYLEDMDLSFRAKKLNLDTYYYPNAVVVHEKHGSSSRSFAILNIYKSLLIFYGKNKKGLEQRAAVSLLYLKAFIAFTLGNILGRKDLANTYSQVLKLF